MRRRVSLILLSVVCLVACAVPKAPKAEDVRSEVLRRVSLPESSAVNPMDGLTEAEAIALALLENRDFQLALTGLALSDADLVQAGQVRNPLFTTFLPVNTKAFEFTLLVPLDAWFLRGSRVENAELDARRVGALLAQGGLDLVRDVRLAFTRLELGRQRAEVLRERAGLASQLADFDRRQLASGELSEFEASLSRVETLNLKRLLAESRTEVHLAEADIRRLLGAAGRAGPRLLSQWREPEVVVLEREQAMQLALRARPDYRAARMDLERARDRAELSKWEWLWLQALFDYDKAKGESEKIGPGFQVELPVFHQNDAGKARARAELMRISSELARQQNQLAADIDRQLAICRQSHESWRLWTVEAMPEIEDLARQAEVAFRAGETTYRPVLLSRDRWQQAKAQQAGLRAALCVAQAELERTLGGRARRPREGGPR